MPRKELQKLLQKTHASLHQDGKIIIISRRNNLLFSLFYHSIKLVFGDDIRKTGIYAFFGPYQPVRSKELKKILKKAGFQTVKEKRYFLIPPFFDQVLQMYLQYKNSEGSSYLHRIRRENILTKILSSLLRLQGFSKNRFGSVSVIEAKKRSVR